MQRIIHIGYMKTATTFLQLNVFNSANYGFGLPGGLKSRANIVNEVVLSDGYTFSAKNARESILSFEEPVCAKGLVPIWSEETLVGEPISGRYDGHAILRRLHSSLPDSKILITIRKQQSMAKSLYFEYLSQGGLASLETFLGTGKEPLSLTPILRRDFLNFNNAISCYQSAFGRGNVLVLPHEILRNDPETFFSRLNKFCGTEVPHTLSAKNTHKSVSPAMFEILRLMNRFSAPDTRTFGGSRRQKNIRRIVHKIDQLIPQLVKNVSGRKFDKQVQDRLYNLFSDSNRVTSDLIDYPLHQLGYD